MRNTFTAISLAALIATGCAARTQESTTPRRFDCGGTSVTADGARLVVAEPDGTRTTLDRYLRADAGDHYASPTGSAYFVPRDQREDGYRMFGGERRGVCIVEAGYTDALQRFMRGSDHHAIAQQLSLDDDDAKHLIRRGLQRLQARYYNDR